VIRTLVGAAGALALFASTCAAQDLDDVTLEERPPLETPIEISELLEKWAEELHTLIVVDPATSGQKLRFTTCDAPLAWGVFKKVLDFNDVLLEEKEVEGHRIFVSYARRHLRPKCGPPFYYYEREDIVTAVLQVVHGAANDIFASMRGLMTRDVERMGNVLYVRGPEIIVLVDYRKNVEFYTRLVRFFDVPNPSPFEVHNHRVEYLRANEALEILEVLHAPSVRFLADERTNVVMASGLHTDLEAAEATLRELDRRHSLRALGIKRRARIRPHGVDALGCAGGAAALAFVGIVRRVARRRRVA
jgi:type II secretory pathway component GspD/PulD (secretin)